MWTVIVGIISLVIAFLSYLFIIADCNGTYADAAKKYGFTLDPGGFFSSSGMFGRYKNYRISVDDTRKTRSYFIGLDLKYCKKISHRFTVKKESVLSFLGLSHDLEIGDISFDENNFIKSDSNSFLISLLNKKLRNKIKKLNSISTNFHINETGITAKVHRKGLGSPNDLICIVDLAVEIAEEINRPVDIKKRLLENIKQEENPKIRKLNLKTLMDNFKNGKEVKKLLNELKKSENVYDQIIAAEYLGKEGIALLMSILRKKIILSNETLCELIGILEKHKVDDDYSIFLEIVKKYNNDIVLAAVIHAMGALELSKFEDFILQSIVTHNEHTYVLGSCNEDVCNAAIEALAKFGTAKLVKKVNKLLKETDDPVLRNRYAQIIAKIQSRLGDVEKGWVSVEESGDLDGALSKDKSSKKGALSKEVN